MSGNASNDVGTADASNDVGTADASNGDGTPVERPAVDDRPRDERGVALRGVVKRYPSGGGEPVVALDDVDFAVRPGEFVAVVGPSGSGKSTLLNVLGLLDDPTAGQRLLDGTDVTDLSVAERTAARKESIGFVFQDFHLLPTLSAVENVAMPTAFDPGDASDRAATLLSRFGLGDRLDHEPSELSGGQKQRVAIARSLVNEPAVLLADEPTGNLDTETGEAILAEFERVKREGVAVVAVTHDPLVEGYADRVVDLTDGVLTGGLPGDGDEPEPTSERSVAGGDR
ncbi:ABC transporter ATP-binding protein [Halorubrum sp. BOL3-1]|uniref:ABC transporter ATP-binding protein n=1 Tax=Halorubrum sp. BOL3-1 TaxID=2497325 RepID=UPI001004F1BE|nr:ABC transporter ATP-binding protein [Halorubrum sp. BOL3-1]QAU14220.1 ABC transporter ATP-binding protein [Halorubrum sp. BOL3-1]